MKKKREDRLLSDGADEEGISNPSMDENQPDITQPSGTDSSPEMEAAEADALVKTLKTKRIRKKRELADQIISPKDDLSRELKEMKRKSKQKLDESSRQELEAATVAEDGTLPLSEGEEGEQTIPEELGVDQSVLKKLKKKPKVQEGAEDVTDGTVPVQEGEEMGAGEPAVPGAEEEGDGAVKRLTFSADKEPSPTVEERTEPDTDRKTPRMASLRSKMKDRLQKAKEEALLEVKQEAKESRKERRERQEKDKKQVTRFDDGLPPEEVERLTEEKRKIREERKKKLASVKKEGVYMPTPEESFEFFTGTFNLDSEPMEEKEIAEKAETEVKEKKEGEEAKETEEGGEGEPKTDKPEDQQPLIADDDEDMGFTFITAPKAEFFDPDEISKLFNAISFYPSSAEIPPANKIAEELEVRRLEEEGLYVGIQPSMSRRNQNRMEHRLLKEIESGRTSSKKWFGEDGKLLALPDPLRMLPSRPPITEDVDLYLQTEYRKAVIREFDNRYIDGSTGGGGHYQLDVDISQIAFSHHHLFSQEHVLSQRLADLYEQYVVRQKKNMTSYLGEKLKALKNSALHLQDHVAAHRSEHSLTDRANYEKRLQDYKAEIRQTRVMRDMEEKRDRQLLKNIIHTWKEIRVQREKQNFTNTPVKVQVRKDEVDKTQDELIWKQEIEAEIEELQDEHDRELKRKMLTYEDEMAKYERQQQAKKDAMKRLKKKHGRKGSKQSAASVLSGDAAIVEYTDEQRQQDQEILDEADLATPEKPEPFDGTAVRQEVTKKAMEIRRRPGEPKLSVELSNTATITPTIQCPILEQKRREDVSKCKVFVKILFNNKEVSRTNVKSLSQDFKVTFGLIYNLKIVQWPESIAFQVYESIGLSTQLMAELCAPIPDTSVVSQSVQLENLEFSSDRKVNHESTAVGSGLPFTFGKDCTELLILMTTGTLTFSVAWAVDEQGHALVPPVALTSVTNLFNELKLMDPLAAIGASGVLDLQKLADWFKASRLDPNDPSNADIVHMLRGRSGDTSFLTPVEFFRLEQLMAEFDFISDEDLKANKRFQLLQLRDEEVQEFKHFKLVPAFEREIPRDAFDEYDKKKREEQKLRQLDDIESQRNAVKRFQQRVREQVMHKFRVQAHIKNLKDVVSEDDMPNIAILGTNFLKLFERQSRLRPKRKEGKQVGALNVKPDEVKILINIGRAHNIPVRISASTAVVGGLTTRSEIPKRQEVQVRPFIEVVFQHQSIRTSVGYGPNPCFNEEMLISFKAPNDDFSPSNLQTVSDVLFLNLFDEVVTDIQEDDRTKDATIHQRIEKIWLGSLKVPFTTIYLNGKIDGTFQVNTPPVLLGYEYDSGTSDPDVLKGEKNERTLLSLFITLEPALTQPEPLKDRFSTNEDEKLMVYADQWKETISNKFIPKREIKTFVTDINFKSVFVTRYIKAIKPPDELTNKGLSPEATAELVARFVSLIPFISDSVIFPGLCDIWNTCDQFLHMLSGDEEEHAILLVNYFLSLGKKAWLICGSAIPEGPSAYVLTEESSGDFLVWNPSTGEHYRTQDINSPLQSIGCLIDSENIWANIQQYDKPSQIMYNLNETSCWTSLFNKTFKSPGLGSIQPDSLYYYKTDADDIIELQEKIQSVLKNKIMDWRIRYITRWNRHCTQIMRKMLPILEENRGKLIGDTHLHELEQSFTAYKVSGFPINMPFTEIEPIVETVLATGVHAHETSDVEFALAVYIHPYPNSVFSVWVYVASLMRIR